MLFYLFMALFVIILNFLRWNLPKFLQHIELCEKRILNTNKDRGCKGRFSDFCKLTCFTAAKKLVLQIFQKHLVPACQVSRNFTEGNAIGSHLKMQGRHKTVCEWKSASEKLNMTFDNEISTCYRISKKRQTNKRTTKNAQINDLCLIYERGLHVISWPVSNSSDRNELKCSAHQSNYKNKSQRLVPLWLCKIRYYKRNFSSLVRFFIWLFLFNQRNGQHSLLYFEL